jgi:hypothetical protein
LLRCRAGQDPIALKKKLNFADFVIRMASLTTKCLIMAL